MDLLEREVQREVLQNALEQVRQGHGSIVLVSGEAGVGKTAFVADFVAPYRSTGQVFWGACDPCICGWECGRIGRSGSGGFIDHRWGLECNQRICG